ncbi:hypothetical protein [Leifsonia aquatica]|uniref:hypothetical protein n=1 Tax=Leifsonia aquatica TaxID=144185 RepID=UPI0004697C4C|nr:hypothetical protein [Leifsonia aquatica]
MATGALDAQGIWQYGEDDPVSPFSSFMNLGMGPVSAQFVADRARLSALETARSGDVPLGSYAPTVTGVTLGTGGSIPYAKWMRLGNRVWVWVVVKLGTSGFSVADPHLALPVQPVAAAMGSRQKIGSCQLIDVSAGISGQFEGTVVLDGTTGRLGGLGGSPLAFTAITTTAPFTWAATDELHITLDYPVA